MSGRRLPREIRKKISSKRRSVRMVNTRDEDKEKPVSRARRRFHLTRSMKGRV